MNKCLEYHIRSRSSFRICLRIGNNYLHCYLCKFECVFDCSCYMVNILTFLVLCRLKNNLIIYLCLFAFKKRFLFVFCLIICVWYCLSIFFFCEYNFILAQHSNKESPCTHTMNTFMIMNINVDFTGFDSLVELCDCI